jgi:hypothetical protein
MNKVILQIILAGFLIFESCSNPSNENGGIVPSYKEILSVNISDINVKMFIKGYDSLTTGYNEIYFKVNKNNIEQKLGYIKYVPIMWMAPGLWHSSPVCAKFQYDNSTGYYKGYAVFLMATSPANYWQGVVNYTDEQGISHISDTVSLAASYHQEKQWRIFYDSTEQASYIITLVKPFIASKGLNDFELLLYRSDALEQDFLRIDSASMRLGVYKTDSLYFSNGNQFPQPDNEGIYRGAINMPQNGAWKVNDTIYYHNHQLTNNPTPIFPFMFEIR